MEFCGRRDELHALSIALGKPHSSTVIVGEAGIGKSGLLNEFCAHTSASDTPVAFGRVEVQFSSLTRDPFMQVLGTLMDSLCDLETVQKKAAKTMQRFGKAAVRVFMSRLDSVVIAFLADVGRKIAGSETVNTIGQIVSTAKMETSALDEARRSLATEPASLFYAVTRVLEVLRSAVPEVKILLIFDQFERAPRRVWLLMQDLIRRQLDGVHVILAIRPEVSQTNDGFSRFVSELQTLVGGDSSGVNILELQGLHENEIREWVLQAKSVELQRSVLTRIRKATSGFPLLIELWLKSSKSLDPADLEGTEFRRSICRLVTTRLKGLSTRCERLLRLFSILQHPPDVNVDPNVYLTLTRASQAELGHCLRELKTRWLLGENLESPWFRHELIKACIEDDLLRAERIALHKQASNYYLEQYRRFYKDKAVPLGVAIDSALHLHSAEDWERSLEHNPTLGRSCFEFGELDLADQCFRRAAEAADKLGNEKALMGVLVDWSIISVSLGKFDDAEKFANRAFTFFERSGDEKGVAVALTRLGSIAKTKGDISTSRRYYHQAMGVYEKIEDMEGRSVCLTELGAVAIWENNLKLAERLLSDSMGIKKQLSDRLGISIVLDLLASISETRGTYERAENLYLRSLSIKSALNDQLGVAILLEHLATLAGKRGDLDAAEELYQQSLLMNESKGNISAIAKNLENLGRIAWARGRTEEAEELLRRSLDVSKGIGSQMGIATSLATLGLFYVSKSRLSDGEKHLRLALEIFVKVGNTPLAEKARNDLQSIRAKMKRKRQH